MMCSKHIKENQENLKKYNFYITKVFEGILHIILPNKWIQIATRCKRIIPRSRNTFFGPSFVPSIYAEV